MTWFTHVPMNWTGFTYEDEQLSYRDLFLQFILLFFFLIYLTELLLFSISYITSLIAYIYKKMNNVPDDIQSNSWDKIRHYVACCLIKFGSVWHGKQMFSS